MFNAEFFGRILMLYLFDKFSLYLTMNKIFILFLFWKSCWRFFFFEDLFTMRSNFTIFKFAIFDLTFVISYDDPFVRLDINLSIMSHKNVLITVCNYSNNIDWK